MRGWAMLALSRSGSAPCERAGGRALGVLEAGRGGAEAAGVREALAGAAMRPVVPDDVGAWALERALAAAGAGAGLRGFVAGTGAAARAAGAAGAMGSLGSCDLRPRRPRGR